MHLRLRDEISAFLLAIFPFFFCISNLYTNRAIRKEWEWVDMANLKGISEVIFFIDLKDEITTLQKTGKTVESHL